MKITGDKNLPALKARAHAQIDAAAEAARGAFITPGSGQAMVYAEKQAEASAFISTYWSKLEPDALDASNWPYLSAEVGLTGAHLLDVASAISARADEWKAAAPKIERARLAAKAAVSAAKTPEQVAAAQKVVWPGA